MTDTAALEKLKLEIKDWEYSFKSANGRNPQKQDIKSNPEIDAKYKEYKQLKAELAGNTEVKPIKQHKHHHHQQHEPHTPVKEHRHRHQHQPRHHDKPQSKPTHSHTKPTTTPVKQTQQYDPPYSGNSASSSDRRQRKQVTQVGPTPLAEGRALAFFDIFDLNKPPIFPAVLPTFGGSAAQTPTSISKKRSHDDFDDDDDDDDDGRAILDTPTKSHSPKHPSSTKVIARTLNRTTPSKNLPSPSSSLLSTPLSSSRNLQQTPTSASYFQQHHDMQRLLSTPSPLKRPQPVVRGLSAILADLRRAQDEAYSEDENVLRELEMNRPDEDQLNSAPPTASAVAAKLSKGKKSKAKTQDRTGTDNAAFHLGEAQEGDIEEMVKQAHERAAARGKNSRYKKAKTQKRTTRLVKMRPTLAAAAKQAEKQKPNADSDSEEEEHDMPTEDDEEVFHNDENESDEYTDNDDDVHHPEEFAPTATTTITMAADIDGIPCSDDEFEDPPSSPSSHPRTNTAKDDPVTLYGNGNYEADAELPPLASYGNNADVDDDEQLAPSTGFKIPAPKIDMQALAKAARESSKRAGGVSNNFQRLKIRSSKGSSGSSGSKYGQRFGRRR